MKKIIIGASIYAVAFLVVTIVIAFLNMQFRNIFKFDFSEPISQELIKSGVGLEKLAKIKKGIEHVVREEYEDSIEVIKDKAILEIKSMEVDPLLIDSIKVLKENLARLEKEKELQLIQKQQITQQDTVSAEYEAWIKNAIGYYEAMDAEQAAKIITSYSDNVARDIIYKMKKKKAVQILSALKPETVNRLIQVEQ